jgi:galactose mutarotase-like enzyme
MAPTTDARPRRIGGYDAVELVAGPLAATFVPDLGMTGVSLRMHGREFLAVPGGLAALRLGHTAGLPLLAPWANRLSGRAYRVGRVAVDLTGMRLNVDDHGLPIHGLLVGRPGWRVDRLDTRGARARVRASIGVDDAAFPFAHRVVVDVSASEDRLTVTTTIVPTGRRAVPVAFGWHPYLRVPAAPRSQWRLRLPARTHLGLDNRGIPDGSSTRERAESAAVARRRFDDLYQLGRGRRLAFEADGGAGIALSCGGGYPYAQVWVPPGRTFGALEPMTAPTNALVAGTTPMVSTGDVFAATFTLTPTV